QCAASKMGFDSPAGDERTQVYKRRSAEQGIKSAKNPDEEKQPRIREKASDVARSSNDAGSNGIADRCGYAEPHAQHLKKPTAVRRPGSYSAGRCVKTSGQLNSQGFREKRHHTDAPEK